MSGLRPVTHEDIANRLDRGDKRFDAVDARLEAIERSGEERTAKQEVMAVDLAAVRELLEVIAAAKRAGRVAVFMGRIFGWLFHRTVSLIKWGGAIAAALAAFFVLFREWANFLNPKG